MEATNRRTRYRTRMWAAAIAAVGIAGPAIAQSPSLMAPRPLNGPDLPGGDKPIVRQQSGAMDDSEPLLPPTGIPLGTPVWAGTPAQLPAMGQSNSALTTAPTALPAPPAAQPVWMVNPQPTSGTMLGGSVTRTPQEFGQGWKAVLNSQPTVQTVSAAVPAAVLAMPRPDWSWHGYDGWNRGNRIPTPPQPSGQGLVQTSTFAAEMSPYMKYAHLWKLSSSAVGGPQVETASTVPMPSAPSAIPPSASAASDIATPLPAAPSGTPKTLPPSIEWRGAVTPDGASSAPSPASYSQPTLPSRPGQPAAEPPAPPPGSAGYRIPLNVRERISAICESKSRNLVVEQPSPIRLRIAFLVRTPADAELLTNQLAALPELGPYKVDFEVQIGQ